MRAACVLLMATAVSAQSYCPASYTGCRPAGERMYTAFPNSPIMGKEFNLLIVGCNMPTTGGDGVNRDYFFVPEAVPCGGVDPDTLPGECKFNADAQELTKRIPAACKGKGWMCTNCAKIAHSDGTGMSTTAISKIIYDQGTADPDEGGELVPLKVCKQSIGYNSAGNRTVVWTPMASHDRMVSQRSDVLSLAQRMVVLGAAEINGAALPVGSDENCCEGLKLGDWCLPLIVFILLWLLMAGLLALLAYMCHKNQRDADAERNNQQFSKFTTDEELVDVQADEDDI